MIKKNKRNTTRKQIIKVIDCSAAGSALDSKDENITPNSNTKNSATKICSKGWVAQELFLIGNLTAALRFSKGWVRKDTNLGLRTGCMSVSSKMLKCRLLEWSLDHPAKCAIWPHAGPLRPPLSPSRRKRKQRNANVKQTYNYSMMNENKNEEQDKCGLAACRPRTPPRRLPTEKANKQTNKHDKHTCT